MVLTDFDNRAALEIYPHIPNSRSVFTGTFAALHRLGIGTDTINSAQAERMENLAKYDLVMLVAATALDNAMAIESMRQYVLQGGMLIVTPFTAYMDRMASFAAMASAPTWPALLVAWRARYAGPGSPEKGNKPQLFVNWSGVGMSGRSPAGLDGYMEYLEIDGPDTNTIAVY